MENKGVLDLSTKALKGLLLLAGLAGGAYIVWRVYNRKRAQEAASLPPAPITVEIPPLKKAKAPKKPKTPRVRAT